ncbi:MAG TPA: chloride channel protein [Candidatus Baltobacteraceae bacterium]|nr:chloride channel protein [Candidatus Baltobacteraceae bacterium]
MIAPARGKLADFTTDPRRLLVMSAFAVLVGLVSAAVAKILLMLIGFITHLLYFQQTGTSLVQPDPHRIGPISIAIPIVGGVLVGLIARFGTDKIRGHGIPEAIQAILDRDSIIQARVAYLKPIASAITIGTGGPFGAEGPIIMTGGAFGSLFAQFLRLSSVERRTLLVCGASGGMAATFGAPIASVLIAVELLLFEWKPRSFIPVAVAAFVADVMRSVLIGPSPPFLVAHPHAIAPSAFGWAAVVGIGGGVVSAIMTKLVYFTEDAYERLPVHWMWWPAIGGAVVGIGGWFVPQALGVGYGTINGMLNAQLAIGVVAGIIVVKIVIWIAALSSGTSGGVLAPLLMIGGAMGTLFSLAIPGHDAMVWSAVGMAAIMGGTMRAPFMATMFALETTHAWGLLPPIFIGCVAATAFTVIFVPRSILTEKLARRGMHVAREYSVHPLELISVGSVMAVRERLVVLEARATLAQVARRVMQLDEELHHAEYPVVNQVGTLLGFVAHAAIVQHGHLANADMVTIETLTRQPLAVHPEDRVRAAAGVMATGGSRSVAVIDEAGQWVGVLTVSDLLEAWKRGLAAETRRVRVRSLRHLSPFALRQREPGVRP